MKKTTKVTKLKEPKFTQDAEPHRPIEQINKEYSDVCAKLGDAVYHAEVLAPKNISALKDKISALNEEFKLAMSLEEQKPAAVPAEQPQAHG